VRPNKTTRVSPEVCFLGYARQFLWMLEIIGNSGVADIKITGLKLVLVHSRKSVRHIARAVMSMVANKSRCIQRLVAEEFFEFGDFVVGLVEIFLGVGGVAVLERVVGFVEEQGHALLAGDYVGAEAVAGGGLLLLEGVEAFVYGVSSDTEFFAVFGEARNFLGVWYCIGRRYGCGCAGRLRYWSLRRLRAGSGRAATYADGSTSAGDRCGAVLGRRYRGVRTRDLDIAVGSGADAATRTFDRYIAFVIDGDSDAWSLNGDRRIR